MAKKDIDRQILMRPNCWDSVIFLKKIVIMNVNERWTFTDGHKSERSLDC
jgi:hypothetical protein